MESSTVFKALIREVSIAGLPLNYVVFLGGIVLLGFILTVSLLYCIGSIAIGYPLLRAMSAYDPKLISVFINTTQATTINMRALNEKGLVYRA